jgi:hypothetical protein
MTARLVDKVKINLNMLGVLVLNRVGREVDNADVVAIDQSASWQGIVQLHKQLMKSARLCHAVTTWYSGSALKPEMTLCRFKDQETRLSPRNTT